MKIDQDFNRMQLRKLEQLLKQGKETYRVDMHLHTLHSSDGIQTVKETILKAKENQFEVISITDHDSINAYDEILQSKIYEHEDVPIIIPGIEFTVSYPEYRGRCHILKYFFDMDNKNFLDNIKQNEIAFKNRVHLWFIRIQENSCLQYFFRKHSIRVSEEAYFEFLQNNDVHIPEYQTLMKYIYQLLAEKEVDIWDVYKRTIADNKKDTCELRKRKKEILLQKFYDKYKDKDISYNSRKLRPLLAPVGVDDSDYLEEKSTGSLSIGEYGQVPIRALTNAGINIFAHPDMERLLCIDGLESVICGLELNCHSSLESNEEVKQKANQKGIFFIKGSDKHTNSDEYYENLNFYELPRKELKNFIMQAERSINGY